MITFEIQGGDQLRARLAAMKRGVPEKMGRAVYEETLIEQREALKRTPLDTGALRGSYRVSLPREEGRTVSCTITVGGPAAPYAVFVHEIDKDYRVGQWKYLESTVNESAPYFPRRVAARLKLL